MNTAVIFAAIFGMANCIPVPQDQQLNGIQPQFNPQLLYNHLQLQQGQGLLQPQLFQQQQLQQPQALNLPANTQLSQTQNLFQQAPQQFQPVPPTPQQQQRAQLQAQAQAQAQPQQYIQQQVTPASAQQLQQLQQFRALQQQQPQQALLGVAYSSAADVAKTQFNGYGISYNF